MEYVQPKDGRVPFMEAQIMSVTDMTASLAEAVKQQHEFLVATTASFQDVGRRPTASLEVACAREAVSEKHGASGGGPEDASMPGTRSLERVRLRASQSEVL